MKIFIFGYTGMLGMYVYTYLKKRNFEVFGLNRENIDVSNIKENDLEYNLSSMSLNKNDVVINCIGTIKPRVDELGELNAIVVNSVFPRLLANVAEKFEIKMIHPTTDCVFDGLKGSYNEKDLHNVTDIYGRTKSLGEPSNCTVIRTSIIGEELNQKRSLIEWIKSNKNGEIFGFTNHVWNGITCLKFAEICEEIIEKKLFWKGTKHIFSPNKVSKFELTKMISHIYDLNIKINPKETEIKCDRSLSTIYEKIFNIEELEDQIIKQNKFYSK